jgi:hypothetical protein
VALEFSNTEAIFLTEGGGGDPGEQLAVEVFDLIVETDFTGHRESSGFGMHWLADPISISRNLIAGVGGADVKLLPPRFWNNRWGDDLYTFVDF